MILLNDYEAEALNRLLRYVAQDEERNYDGDHPQQAEHIYTSIWLLLRAAGWDMTDWTTPTDEETR